MTADQVKQLIHEGRLHVSEPFEIRDLLVAVAPTGNDVRITPIAGRAVLLELVR